MEKGWGNPGWLHSISPIVKQQKEPKSNQGQSIFPEREGRSWRGMIGKKWLNESETKAKIRRQKKRRDFGKESYSSFSAKCNSRTHKFPPMKGRLWVSCLEGGLRGLLNPIDLLFQMGFWTFFFWGGKKNNTFNIYKSRKNYIRNHHYPRPVSAVTDIYCLLVSSIPPNGILNLWFSF